MTYKEIQEKVIQDHRITINEHSTCWGRMHAHVKTRTICKWKPKNSIQATFDLFHEIGHIETTKSNMRRCESEYHATVYAIKLCKQYGLKIPEKIYEVYQNYIFMELDSGIRRGGQNLPSKEDLILPRITETKETKVRITKCYLVQVLDKDGNEIIGTYVFGDKSDAIEAGKDMQDAII